MRFPSNTINDIARVLNNLLHGLYDVREAESITYLVLEKYTGEKKVLLKAHPEKRVSESVINNIVEAAESLLQNIPVQYVLGETTFYGYEFKVNSDVLIPRPETEELVEWVIQDMHEKNDIHIMDIGTGSGCIAVSLKKNLPSACILAVDISEKALYVARENALRNQVDVDYMRMDILNPFYAGTTAELDAIVSNPPYVRDSEKGHMQQNVLAHEPHSALFVADDDPFIFYGSILAFADSYLKKNGFIYFEINEYLSFELIQYIKNKGFSDIKMKHDLQGKPRFIKIKKPA